MDLVQMRALQHNLGGRNRKNLAVLNSIAAYFEGADQRDIRSSDFKVRYLGYDWSLNERKTVKPKKAE